MACRAGTCMAQVTPTGICSEELEVQHVAEPPNDLENAEYCLKSFHWMEAKLQNRHPTPPTGPDDFSIHQPMRWTK